MAAPTDWYVDPVNGSNSNGGTSLVDAWLTFSYAAATVAASPSADGDRINLRNNAVHTLTAAVPLSTYAPSISKPFIVRGFTDTIGDGGRAVIDGDGKTYGISNTGSVVNYTSWKDLKIQDVSVAAASGYVLRVGNSEFDNVWFDDCAAGYIGATSVGLHFHNCAFTNNPGAGEGIVLPGTGTVIDRCFFAGNSKPCVYASAVNSVFVRNCIFNTNNQNGVETWGDCVLVVVDSCSFFDSTGTTRSGVSLHANTSHSTVRDCLFEGYSGTGGSGIDASNSGTRGRTLASIENNSFYNCASSVENLNDEIAIYTGNETLGASPFAKSGSATDPDNAATYYAPQDTGSVLTADGFGHVRGAIAYVPAATPALPSTWDNWSHYYTITSKNAEIDAVTTHVMLDLSLIPSGSEWWSNVQADGDDVRILDPDNNEIEYVFAEPINTTAKTGVIVLDSSASLSTSEDVEYKILCGNSGASAPSYTTFSPTGSPTMGFELAEDPSGSAPQLLDYVGGNNATTVGSMVSGDVVAGKIGKALQFESASSQYAYASVPGGLNTSGSYSICCWAKLSTYSSGTYYTPFAINGANYSAIFFQKEGSTGNRWRCVMPTDDSSPSFVTIDSSITPTVGQWYHLAATIDAAGPTLSFYIDGTLISTASPTLWAATGAVTIGAGAFAGTTPNAEFNGTVDGCKIFAGTVLTADQINTIINNETANNGIWTAGALYSNPGSGGGGGSGAIVRFPWTVGA